MFRAHVLIIRGCVMQFRPPDDEHMCSKHGIRRSKLHYTTSGINIPIGIMMPEAV